MKIRLWGLPEENDQVAEALRGIFAVVDESADYAPNRGTSPLRRRYLELRLEGTARVAGPDTASFRAKVDAVCADLGLPPIE